VTEAEWLTEGEVWELAQGTLPLVGERQRRLAACAVLRRVWRRLFDERARAAVVASERFADGRLTPDELAAAAAAAEEVAAAFAADHGETDFIGQETAMALRGAAYLARGAYLEAVFGAWYAAGDDERRAMARDLRDVFGNPFRAARLAPGVLASNGGAVGKIARAIHEAQRFEDLPVLADAIEEAGCADADVLAHCRGGGGHVRGCWVIAAILDGEAGG
jgi:hypothetical protein